MTIPRFQWSQDSFRGWDKVEHVIWAYAGWLTLAPFVGWGWATLILIVASLLVEAVQWMRSEMGFTDYADHPSWRDLVADAVGIALAFVVFCLGAWFGQ